MCWRLVGKQDGTWPVTFWAFQYLSLWTDWLLCLQGPSNQTVLSVDPCRGEVFSSRWVCYDHLWSVKVTLNIGGQEYDLEVVVADLGCQSAILGLDFLEEQSTVLKVQGGTLLIDNEPVMLYREQAQPGCNEIQIEETLSIPPRSWRVVEVGIDLGTLANGMTDLGIGAEESLSTLADISGIMMDRGVVSVHNGKVPVNLINVHDSEITLHFLNHAH